MACPYDTARMGFASERHLSNPADAANPLKTYSSSAANRIEAADPLDIRIDEFGGADLPLANHLEQIRRRQEGEICAHVGADSSASRARTIDSIRSKERT
jgi:hypothetical protein